MYIDDFIWLPDVVEKLVVKHHVIQDEVEEVFFNHPQYMDRQERRQYERA